MSLLTQASPGGFRHWRLKIKAYPSGVFASCWGMREGGRRHCHWHHLRVCFKVIIKFLTELLECRGKRSGCRINVFLRPLVRCSTCPLLVSCHQDLGQDTLPDPLCVCVYIRLSPVQLRWIVWGSDLVLGMLLFIVCKIALAAVKHKLKQSLNVRERLRV